MLNLGSVHSSFKHFRTASYSPLRLTIGLVFGILGPSILKEALH